VPIGDAAAVGADLHHPAVARFALLLQEIVVQALQIHSPPDQRQHPGEQDCKQQA
jgi:hypothetical protein